MPKENEDGTEIPTKKALTSEDLSQVGSKYSFSIS